MIFPKLINRSTLVGALIISLAACSSKPEVKEFPKSADAKQEITNLEIALENSKAEDSELLAPVSFKEARKSLNEAKKMEKDKKDDKKVLKEVALGQAYLEQAQKNAQNGREKLQDVMAARQAAIKAGAAELLPGDLAKIDKKVKEETAKIEEKKDTKIKDKRADFITGYLDLELASVKKTYLGESRFLIDESVKNGARDLTPKTLSATNKSYQEAESFITQNRNETAEIEARAAAVLAEARQLEATTATARGLSASTPEETALRMQAEQNRLNRTQEALFIEQESNSALSASNAELSNEQKLNAIYEEARTKFSPQEAEVYKQGSNLVIRLRSLEFPKSQAVIKGENFPLLKKVEEVISSFDQSVVVVEGHTDSTGSKEINQKLSDQRAEAVKQYLEVNASDNVAEFEAKGYGYEKPLASNKTPQGRAQNRRVDVIIEPVQL